MNHTNTQNILELDLSNNSELTEIGQYSFFEGDFGCFIKTKNSSSFNEVLSDGFLEITDMVDNIYIYESIFKNFITAEISIIDRYDIISKLDITGNEFVKIKFGTKGSEYPIDMILVLSKIKNKNEFNPQFTKYTFSLISEGFLKNQRTKISKTYTGSFSSMVESIFLDDELGFPISDTLFLEDTVSSKNRLIIPNISPVDAINMIASFSVGEMYDNATYLFFQTTKQYQFRSTASIINAIGSSKNFLKFGHAFTVKKEIPKLSSISEKMMNISEFEMLNDFDILKSTSIGSLGSKLIEHDIYRKAIYTREFEVLRDKYGGSDKYINLNENYIYPQGSVAKDNKDLSSFINSYINVVSSARADQYADNIGQESERTQFDKLPYDETILNRNSELTSLMINRAKIKIPGISGLQPGDIIKIAKSVFINNEHVEDKKLSGLWIIESISHQVGEKYFCIMYIIRDSYDKEYSDSYTFENISVESDPRITDTDSVN